MRKLGTDLLQKVRDRQRTPSHLFGGRVRTSTVVLIVAFFALWWTYATYRPHPEPARSDTPPPGQVVPPGFVPDPGYTWVPRTRVQQQPVATTPTPTPTTTPPPPPPTTTTTTTTPGLPCLLPPPFCPASTTPTTPPANQQPGPGPAPSSTPPAR